MRYLWTLPVLVQIGRGLDTFYTIFSHCLETYGCLLWGCTLLSSYLPLFIVESKCYIWLSITKIGSLKHKLDTFFSPDCADHNLTLAIVFLCTYCTTLLKIYTMGCNGPCTVKAVTSGLEFRANYLKWLTGLHQLISGVKFDPMLEVQSQIPCPESSCL